MSNKVSKSKFDSLLWRKFDKDVKKIKTSSNPTAAGIIEVDSYLKKTIIERHEDPLLWWRNKKHQYPRLYDLVTKRLITVGTSVPCERLFSKAGQIITEKRSRLTSSKASQIIFLNGNLE
ncbi:hypothetical protein NQ314_020988 [Rhamnusium bicolor]|uniref:HAT C-terminal dimerisation domain-containing protein n=1 Tax=Rhamnusium bicolor TaxID=1586634 RepID=A0AAV8WJ62_9CUCU|nr:hypothetical protein NQ314_020988 [Rhamnusium bicolor]